MNSFPFCNTDIEFVTKEDLIDKILLIENKNLLFLMSESSLKRWSLELMLKGLDTTNNIVWINNINSNPTQQDIANAYLKINGIKIDLILAIGGGSTIDLAKSISALYEEGKKVYSIEEITNEIEEKKYIDKKNFIDIIAVPTTAGTSSELTQWATIWDINHQKKFSIDVLGLKPKKAYIVPELTLSLPVELTLFTGLDALSHAIEAYWSNHTNPLVQELSYRSIQILFETLPKLKYELNNLNLRENMCKATVLAGLAFACTRTTACHSISYPLTMFYGIPHGIATAMTLDGVSKRNKGKFPNENVLFELFSQYGGLQKWMTEICEGVVSLRLSKFDVKEQDLDLIVDNAFTAGRMDNNPVKLSKEDVKEILRNIL